MGDSSLETASDARHTKSSITNARTHIRRGGEFIFWRVCSGGEKKEAEMSRRRQPVDATEKNPRFVGHEKAKEKL